MSKITYTRTSADIAPIIVKNSHGIVTKLGDLLAWTMFLEGAVIVRKRGVDITVFDCDGQLLVGDFSDKSIPVEVA